jgi:hypothetical protein
MFKYHVYKKWQENVTSEGIFQKWLCEEKLSKVFVPKTIHTLSSYTFLSIMELHYAHMVSISNNITTSLYSLPLWTHA